MGIFVESIQKIKNGACDPGEDDQGKASSETVDLASKEAGIAEYTNRSFLQSYPEFAQTALLDKLRQSEYGYLDEQKHVYLDYTGAGLAARAQYRAHEKRIGNQAFGNPHSVSPTSEASTALVEEARRRVLAHFSASAEDYAVIFRANASGAARLVGESYPFGRGKRLVLMSDNHNSFNGLREFAKRRHTRTVYVPSRAPGLRIRPEHLDRALRKPCTWLNCLSPTPRRGSAGLFAYPAQSNFSGVRHPLEWVTLAQKRGYHVLLDAAACAAGYVLVSWYKVLGYPTGVGCLVARRDALSRLSRPWFAGGTVQTVSVSLPWHVMAPDESAFEDGTLNFLAIPDVITGLDWLAGIGLSMIGTRVRCLTAWFLDRLRALHHTDGRPMARIYGPADTTMRGATVAFNFLDAAGRVVDERRVARDSAAAGISLQCGCFCNPGCGEDAFALEPKMVRRLMRSRSRSRSRTMARGDGGPPDEDDYDRVIGLLSAWAIRVSFGVASTRGDVDGFFRWTETTYRDRVTTGEGLPPRERC